MENLRGKNSTLSFAKGYKYIVSVQKNVWRRILWTKLTVVPVSELSLVIDESVETIKLTRIVEFINRMNLSMSNSRETSYLVIAYNSHWSNKVLTVTGGEAWVGVCRLLAESTKCFGLRRPFGSHCATHFSYAAHISGYHKSGKSIMWP